MRELIGIAVVALLGYYFYQEMYGAPAPARIDTAPDPAPAVPARRADRKFPSSYTDPDYIHPETLGEGQAPEYAALPSRNPHTSTIADAPVQCGPYFLYFHPDSQKWEAQQGTRVITVSRTPPDLDIENIQQIWAFADSIARGSNYPKNGDLAWLKRKDLRPVMIAQVTGIYIGGHTCVPYKPLTLSCTKTSPWC